MRALRSLLLLAVVGCAFTTPPSDAPVRVLVYNIHAGKDAGGVENLERVAALIAESKADVVLLQEIDRKTRRSGNVDHFEVLKRLTGMHGAFGKSLDYQGGEYGIATLSRWPISSSRVVPLRVAPPQARAGGSIEPRVALATTIASPRGALTVLNTHLDASREDVYRLQEVEQLARTVSDLGAESVLLGGDLNANPPSEVHAALRRVGLKDAWIGCGRGAEHTFPASAPIKRIDYLYADATWKCVEAAVMQSDASDHRPVLFTLE